MRRRLLVAVLYAALSASPLVSCACFANAADIKVLSGSGIREVVQDLTAKFEHATGHKLAISFASVGTIVNRVRDGESADVLIIPRQGFDSLVKDGKASAGDVTVIARGGIGIAVRKGVARPDISTPDALKRALLSAKSITYLDPAAGGSSGAHFAKVLERLGIADAMRGKTVLHRNAAAAAAQLVNG